MHSQEYERLKKEVLGDNDQYKPHAAFYDHPIPDEEKTKASGRPRFKESTYVKITPTHPELIVRDYISRPLRESDKREFPQSWEYYKNAKEHLANRAPLLKLMPGMTVSAFAELQALNLYTCEDLANYDGDIGELGFLRTLAIEIMRLSDGLSNSESERCDTEAVPARRSFESLQTGIPGGNSGVRNSGACVGGIRQTQAENKEESKQEESQKGDLTFAYSVEI